MAVHLKHPQLELILLVLHAPNNASEIDLIVLVETLLWHGAAESLPCGEGGYG